MLMVALNEIGQTEDLERPPQTGLNVHDDQLAAVFLEAAVRFEQHRDPGRVNKRQMRAVDEDIRVAHTMERRSSRMPGADARSTSPRSV
jgi:hypothetical protein